MLLEILFFLAPLRTNILFPPCSSSMSHCVFLESNFTLLELLETLFFLAPLRIASIAETRPTKKIRLTKKIRAKYFPKDYNIESFMLAVLDSISMAFQQTHENISSIKAIKGTINTNFLIITIVKEIKDPILNILQHYFKFASLETLSDRVGQRQILTDVIEKLHAIEEEQVDVKGKLTKIRRMELILKENIVLKVTLWRNLSNQINKEITTQIKGQKIVALTSTLVSEYKEIEEFTQLTYGTDQHEEVIEIPSQDNANTNLQSRMIRNRITIQDLMAMQWESDYQKKIFTILAIINGIDDKFGWNYVECEKYHKKAYKKGDNYICGTCNQTPQYPTIRPEVAKHLRIERYDVSRLGRAIFIPQHDSVAAGWMQELWVLPSLGQLPSLMGLVANSMTIRTSILRLFEIFPSENCVNVLIVGNDGKMWVMDLPFWSLEQAKEESKKHHVKLSGRPISISSQLTFAKHNISSTLTSTLLPLPYPFVFVRDLSLTALPYLSYFLDLPNMAAALVGGAFLSSFLNVLFDRLSDPEIINLIRGKKLSEKMIQRFKAILNGAEALLNDAERRQIREGPVKIWLDDLKDAIYEADDFLDEITTKAATKKDQGNCLTRFLNLKDRKRVNRMEDVIARLESIVNQKDTLGLKEIPMENMSWRTPSTSLVKDAKTRHLSYNLMDNDSVPKMLEACESLCHVRTLFQIKVYLYGYKEGIDPCRLLAQLKRLRVLSFPSFQIDRLPDSIGELIHLRYLNLSDTLVVTLPKSLNNLYKEKHEENGIGELGELAHLHDSLCIQELENVKNSGEASSARIYEKIHLNALYLRWSSFEESEVCDSESEKDVLDKLRPHKDLKKLSIRCYRGTMFPDWVGHSSYHNMTWLELRGCRNCWVLPSLGQLPSLERLLIGELDKVKKIGGSFYKGDATHQHQQTPFRSLKFLVIEELPCWEEWESYECDDDDHAPFPKLETLIIQNCPKLRGDLPTFLPSLKSLDIYGCEEIGCYLPRAPILRELRIYGKQEARMRELPLSMLERLVINGEQQVEYVFDAMTHTQPTSLRELRISNCSSAISFPGDSLPPSLKELAIYDCKNVEFPMQHQQHESLRGLTIDNSSRNKLKQSWSKLNLESRGTWSRMISRVPKMLEACESLSHLRTLFQIEAYLYGGHKEGIDPCGLLAQLKRLRVLSFASFKIDRLPDSIGELIHLRYLNLSNTLVVTLPESLNNLYNLQTLKLRNCEKLKKLPSNMQDLVNLRHLDIAGTDLEEMPKKMSKLKDLQFLSGYIAGKHEENGIGELGELAHLHELLFIQKLENVKNSGQSSYHNITELYLRECRNCWVLPSLGQLPALTRLGISDCEKVKKIGGSFYKGDGTHQHQETPFRSLKILVIQTMPCLEEWESYECDDDDDAPFPKLEELSIEDCPKLRGDLPTFLPSLKSLYIRGCEEIGCYLPRAPILRDLRICGKQEARMRELPLSMLRTLWVNGEQQVEYVFEAMTHTQPTSLIHLHISECSSAISFPGDSLPPSLQQLRINNCKNVEFPMQNQQHESLTSLTIKNSWTLNDSSGTHQFNAVRLCTSILLLLHHHALSYTQMEARNKLKQSWSKLNLESRGTWSRMISRGVVSASIRKLNSWKTPSSYKIKRRSK
ncbi:hypothetical protein Ahy_A02g005002 [Arachis hypogaea]|uniref:Uncharacterized protein n=1 Tax=Arachis hypogaea TaxID=3818 RepID=A0A445E5D5_ARAHY|nr:hypothetical protein Ahy_A02g005002 [Arachis hypogaea]